MPKLKYTYGNYKDVIDELSLPDSFYEEMKTEEEYVDTIGRDIPRTWSFGSNDSREKIVNKWLEIPERPFVYTQGDLDARVFTHIGFFLSTLRKNNENFWDNNREKVISEFSTAYLDDNGKLCAFTIRFYDNSENTKEESEKYYFQLAIINDVKAKPEKRQVTILADNVLLSHENMLIQEHDIEKVPSIVKDRLNSKELYYFMEDVFQRKKECFEYIRQIDTKTENHQYIIEELEEKRQKFHIKLELKLFNERRNELLSKEKDLRDKKQADAADAINTLSKSLETNFQEYIKNGDKKAFCTKCLEDINIARPELQKQRNPAIDAIQTTLYFLPKVKPKSTDLLDGLETLIKQHMDQTIKIKPD